MPHQTPCPACLKVGFVRFEYVITGAIARKVCSCGVCEYQWEMTEPRAHTTVFPQLHKVRSRRLGRKRD